MAFIVTFIGKGGTGRTTIAIAAAKKLASQGNRVLLAGQDGGPSLGLRLGTPLGTTPSQIAPNLSAVQLQATALLERSWEDVKELEAKYLRSPTLKSVYGQELGILPGMDSALALNAIREYDRSGNYDVIVYDGTGGLETVRMLGIPEILSWYGRRFRQVFSDSDLGKVLSPFVQPITSAIFNVSWLPGDLTQQPTKEAKDILEEGKAALANPDRFAAYLVTTGDAMAVATAKYLWGSAQQVGVTVKGVLLNQAVTTTALADEFAPLSLTEIPTQQASEWQPLSDALPDLRAASTAPQPTIIDLQERQVRVFLPGFGKNQVKLTQSGPELTIDAGDQRRNIDLPPAWRGQPVKGAKFHGGYLIISF